MDRTRLAEGMMLAALGCGLAALVLPWAAFVFSRRLAAATAGVLALVGSILAATTDQGAIRGNIRMDPIIIPALLLVAWVECACLDGVPGRPPAAARACRRKSCCRSRAWRWRSWWCWR